MFGSSKKTNQDMIGADIETIIGKNTSLKGIVKGSGNIRIDGTIEGEIEVSGDVVIGEAGAVTASIKANNVLISGTVRGNVDISGKLEILSTGKLYGDFNSSILSVAEGAVFKGNSNMGSKQERAEEPVKKQK